MAVPSPAGNGNPPPASRRWLASVAVIGMVALVAWLAVYARRPNVADAQAALDDGEFSVAQNIAERLLAADPRSASALVIAGRAALARQQLETALRYFDRLEDDGSDEAISAFVLSGEAAIQLGRLSDAERYFRRVLAHHPSHLDANQHLLSLLRVEGRNWEAVPHVSQLCLQQRYVVDYLEAAGLPSITWLDRDTDLPFLDFCSAQQPDDPLNQLGPLRMLMDRQLEGEMVETRLAEIVATHPEIIEAQAMLGQLRLDAGDDDRFLAWHAQLPPSADRHPAVWVTRGRWLHGHGNTRSAVRCLWEALRRFPHDRAATLLIANLLASLGEHERAAGFYRRGEDLQAFDDLLLRGPRLAGHRTAERLTRMIQLLERLDRRWEALGWSHHLLEVDRDSEFARAAISRLGGSGNAPPQASAAIADLADFPLPDWQAAARLAVGPAEATGGIAFQDVAGKVGLDFVFFVDRQRMRDTVYTFDFAGGGAGVLDFDRDGWPDLYLTQASRWPRRKENGEHQNALFRNRDGESFDQVGALAGVGDTGFGSGPAVGDVDCDGFPDIFIANVGANKLYLNNGDGTFRDASETVAGQEDDFTLSAVLVDLNRDQLPDLYVVNYLGGDALTRQCRDQGKPVQCSPLEFPGQADRLYINRGDGRFDEVNGDAGLANRAGSGKGMGVIAADLDGAGGIDLFVTNDTTSNSLLINETDAAGGPIRFNEMGSQAGVAYDAIGRLQGSMGIAAGDVNADGLIDLFVTNFNIEPNNLFVQLTNQPDPLFSDRGLEAKLARPSVKKVGWGAQFLDPELDGDLDLVVANGALEDPPDGSAPGAQPDQFFENDGSGVFRELPASGLGACFAAGSFSRAVARVDWNRDGLEDLCITHLDTPVSLLENNSRRRGRYIAIQLVGTASNRDAIGARIHVVAGGRQWTVQQVAGDGFEASNQRQLLLGLGDCNRVDQLRVRWPSGGEQEFHDLAVDCEWIVVEGVAPLRKK